MKGSGGYEGRCEQEEGYLQVGVLSDDSDASLEVA